MEEGADWFVNFVFDWFSGVSLAVLVYFFVIDSEEYVVGWFNHFFSSFVGGEMGGGVYDFG